MYGGGIISTVSFAVVTASVGLAAMLWMDVPLALACVAVYLLQVVAMYLFAPLARSAATQLVAARANLTETVRETVTGAAHVKTAGLGSNVTERFEARLATLERAQLRQLWVDRWHSLALILPEMLGVGTVYLYGGYRVLTGHLTVGGLVAFAVYAWWLQNPVEILTSSVAKRLQRWLPGVERTFALLDDPGAGAVAGGLRPAACQGALSLEGVTFGYEPGRPILQGLSLTVAPGELVAVVGPSGAGKSTLGDLLLGLQEPQAGRICLDGHDLGTLDPTWLRQQVCAIAQDVAVLNETVSGNVAYGRPDAAAAEVAAACESAALNEFVASLPQGLETTVGERGLQLSGGQRQRLSIARALLYGPQVLVLDEATSALDTATEARVMAEIRRQLAGRTLVVIAHRLSTVVDADRIVVLDGGRVAEEGRHAELMARGGLYRQLYAREVSATSEKEAERCTAM
jgi:ABC-type multidrug transport system fused ATPase/permease subunit